MDIPALSIAMSQTELQQNVSVALSKKVMDFSQTQGEGLLQMLRTPMAPHPTSGNRIDLKG